MTTRILIIEDDPEIVNMFKEFFEGLVNIESSNTASSLSSSKDYNLVILDYSVLTNKWLEYIENTYVENLVIFSGRMLESDPLAKRYIAINKVDVMKVVDLIKYKTDTQTSSKKVFSQVS